MPEIDPVILHLRAETDQYVGELRRAGRQVDTEVDRQQRAFNKLGGLLAGISAAALVREYLRLADASKQLDAQLKLATATFGTFNQAREDAIRLAEATRSDLTATVSLYGNFIRATQQLGGSQEQAARATETFSKALKIGGADANQAASATLQFGQALASGALRGDEFNSIAEASPRILRLLADALGVSQGAVRSLAAEGKLTSDLLFRALTERKFTDAIDNEFKQLPVTFGEAMQQVENAAVLTFGAFDEGGQFSTAISNFVLNGSKGFGDLADRARDEGANIRAAFVGLGDVFEPLLAGATGVFGSIQQQANYTRDSIASILSGYDQLNNFLIDIDNRGRRFDNAIKRTINGAIESSARRGGRTPVLFKEQPLVERSNKAGQFIGSYDEERKRERLQRAVRRLEGQGFIVPLLPNGLPDEANIRRREAAPVVRSTPVSSAPKPRGRTSTRARALGSTSTKAINASELLLDVNKAIADTEDRLDRLNVSGSDFTSRLQGLFRDQFGREGVDFADPFAGVDDYDRQQRERSDASNDAEQRAQQVREDNIRSLADLYTDLFTQSTGDIFENFKRQGLRAIAIVLAQATVASFTNGGGGFGSLLANIGKAAGQQFGGGGFGRASGGFVGAGQLVRVNEGASPGRVEGFRPVGAGTVIPLGQMARAAGGNTTIVHAPQFNLRGAIVTRELYADMQRISEASAAQAGRTAYGQAMRDAPAAVSKAQRFGS